MAYPQRLAPYGPIGIGCAYLAAGSLTGHENRLIGTALDTGARHFDVAPSYGLGTAERTLGRALGKRRDEVAIVTKVGICRPAVSPVKQVARSLLAPVRARLRGSRLSQAVVRAAGPARSLDFSPAYVAQSLEESLTALGTDRVEGFLLHMPTLEDLGDELLAVLETARQSGRARSIGTATTREETARILEAYPGFFDVVQYSWSALDAPLETTGPFRITHRALLRALGPLEDWLAAEPDRLAQASAQSGLDFADSRVLSRALIGAALVENVGGTVLVASRDIARTRANVETALDPDTRIAGRALLDLLGTSQPLPTPID